MLTDAEKLTHFIKRLIDFRLIERGEPYTHMGAVITDAILQAGMRYKAQVWPRVERVLVQHPEVSTSSAFLRLLVDQTPEVVVQINGRKAHRVQLLTTFFIEHAVETVADLSAWLQTADHAEQLLMLPGIGLKTVNYLKLLSGIPDSVAVDTHIRAFLALADIKPTDDHDAGRIVAEAAGLLNVTPAQLDASIWFYCTDYDGILPVHPAEDGHGHTMALE